MYAVNELVMALGDDKVWRQGFILKRLPGKESSFEVKIIEDPQGTYIRSYRKLARASVYKCMHCSNWFNALAVPSIDPALGSRRDVHFEVTPVCIHDGMPFTMSRVPWTEVPGVTAIGGIQAS